MTRVRSWAAAWLAVALCVGGTTAIGAQKPAAPLAVNGGDNLMYIGTYAGTIQPDGSLKGTVNYAGMMDGTFTATKKK